MGGPAAPKDPEKKTGGFLYYEGKRNFRLPEERR